MIEQAPEESTEQLARVMSVLKNIWETVLGVPVRPTDNFFDLDGDSFDAVRILTRIRSELGCKVTIVDLFDRPSLEELMPVVTQLLAPAGHVSAVPADRDT